MVSDIYSNTAQLQLSILRHFLYLHTLYRHNAVVIVSAQIFKNQRLMYEEYRVNK
jgi:hypothetical protein